MQIQFWTRYFNLASLYFQETLGLPKKSQEGLQSPSFGLFLTRMFAVVQEKPYSNKISLAMKCHGSGAPCIRKLWIVGIFMCSSGFPGFQVCSCPGSPMGCEEQNYLLSSCKTLQTVEGRTWDLGKRGCSFELFWDVQSLSMALCILMTVLQSNVHVLEQKYFCKYFNGGRE